MEDRVTIAIIDATAGARLEPSPLSAASRYLTPIANLPLICHVFDELAGGGIEQARIVASSTARAELEAVLDGGRLWGVEVSYLDAPENDGNPVVLAEIEQALSDGSVLVHPGDCLFPRHVALLCERFRAGDVDLVLLGRESGVPPRNAARDPREPERICDTALVLGPATRPVLDELLMPREGAADLVEALLASDCRSAICELTEHWFYDDSNEALLAANRMVLDGLAVPAVHGEFAAHNRVHGRVAISPEARISGSVLHGPIVIDDGAVVEDSFIGPYTAIGAGAVVSGADIDNSMVLAQAEVRHPGLRIEASIIGERARVGRSFELPKGLHLRLGPDSEVTLS
jgi:glucose-1-phosphate thymidylyltransferase